MVIFIVLLITEEFFRRYPRFTLAFFLIVSVVLFSCWILLTGFLDWFPWVKVLSVALGIIVFSIFRNTKLGNTKLCQWTVYLLLVVNIIEAIIRDMVGGNIANYLNAIAGVLLIATLDKINTIHIDTEERYKDLSWKSMTMPWIIGYTLWNWVFVYLNFGFQSSIQHIAVLGSALIIAFINKARWLQARVFTLGTYFIIFHSAPHLNYRLLTDTPNEQFGFFMAMIAFWFMAVYAVFFIKFRNVKSVMM